jgi:hypothetical protein
VGIDLAWPSGIVLTFTFLLLLFPTGALPSRRWRPVAWLAWAAIALTVIPIAIAGWPIRGPVLVNIGESAPAASSAAFKTAYDVQVAGVLLTFALGLASAASLVVRLRRAHGDERAQLAWFAFGGTLLVVGLILSSPLFHVGTDILPPLVLPLLPLAAAVAILKYRLYDIDVVINKTVVFGTLTVVITAIYAAIVAGIGTLVGHKGSLLLAGLAAAVVAVAFQPLRQRAQHLANRVVYGRRATPYEVLSDFSGRVAGTYATEDVLPQMAKILAGGTGATSAGVWLATGPELRLSAAWPEQTPGPGVVRLAGDSVPAIPGAGGVVPVRHQGQLLGALAVTMPPTEPLTPAGEKLVRDLAAQAGLVVRNVRLVEDLLASRQRLVATQDQERRKLERNLHDGAQQQLVALTSSNGWRRTWSGRTRTGRSRCSPTFSRRHARRWRICGSSRGGSTRRCWPTKGWWQPSSPAHETAPCRSRSTPTAPAGTPSRWRPPSTSAAWRPCRTWRSTPEPQPSTSTWPTKEDG